MLVMRRGRRLHRDASYDFKTVPFEPEDLLGIVRDQAHLAHAEVGQDLRADAVVAFVDRQAQREVRLDRIGAAILQLVRAQFIGKPDTASLLAQVAGYLVEFNTSFMMRAYKDDGSFTLVPMHTFPHIANYGSRVGFWVGALALVWLATSTLTSPNKRWSGRES